MVVDRKLQGEHFEKGVMRSQGWEWCMFQELLGAMAYLIMIQPEGFRA